MWMNLCWDTQWQLDVLGNIDLLLKHLETCKYKVSQRKAKMCQQQCHYVEFTI